MRQDDVTGTVLRAAEVGKPGTAAVLEKDAHCRYCVTPQGEIQEYIFSLSSFIIIRWPTTTSKSS